jgi:tetratricopeptide (TPR) repeat protein
LTKHLAPHLGTMPVLVLGAYRDADFALVERRGLAQAFSQLLQRVRGVAGETRPESHPLTRAIEQLRGQRLGRVVAIGPLPEPKVGALLATLAQKNPSAALARKFFEATGGNPFFVEELFRCMNEEQRLFDAQHNWRRDLDLEQIDVPSGIRLVVGRRLQRMSAKTNEVLQAAAVLGPYFELDPLEAVAEVNAATLVTALEQAERANLVKGPSGRQERRWRFAHQLICQTLTSTLSGAKLQRLHLRAADTLDRLARGSGSYTSEIAHHLYSAGHLADDGRTARALMAAGRASDAVYATGEALRHYARAVEILKHAKGSDSDLLAATERVADLLAMTGDRSAAMVHYADVASLCAHLAKSVDQARVVRKMGSLQWQGGDRAEAIRSFEQARCLLEGQDAHLELAHVHQELGLAAFRGGDHRRAMEWAERAVSDAEAVFSARESAADVKRVAAAAIAHATNTIGVALAHSGELDAARERIERSVATSIEHGLLDVACRGYANLGVVYGTLEPERAIDASLTGLDLATKIGAVTLQPYLYANLGAAYCALTDNCEAEGLSAARTAADLDRELGQLDHLAVPLIVMAQIHQCQGELQQAQDVYGEALTLAERAGDPQLLFPCYDGLATIHLDRGDRELAEEYMKKAQETCARAGVDPDTLLVLPFLC